MTAGAGVGVHPSRFAVLSLLLAALAAAWTLGIPSTAHAQERERIGIATGLINRLFGPREVQRVEPQRREPAAAAKPKPRKKRAVRAPVEGAEPPQAATVTKRPDARAVVVVGDFLAGGLAEGLTTAFTENPDIRIVDRSNGSSGFVRQDFHDWAEKINEIITAERPAAVIVMIGANDRQQMNVEGVREELRSENWDRAYASRARELAAAIAARKVPFLWVGAPPFKSPKMMPDMMAFNEMYRAAAVSAGGEFVDIWDGFVDEKGAYIANGPDLNGQPARLRANDGINFARPGKRKIAFYAERPLYRLLGGDPSALASSGSLATRPAYRMFGPFGPSDLQDRPELDIAVDPNSVGLLDPTRPAALRTPGLDGGEELMGLVAEVRHEARTPAEKLIIEGFAAAPPAGRADQPSWPQLASAASAMRKINIDRTLNKASTPSAPREPAEDRANPRSVRSDVLANPEPPMPPRAAPEMREDRLDEISPQRPAPDVAGGEPPMTTPATIDKASVPEFATGDPRDRSPARNGAPLKSFKRPTSIGPEPNRAPTALPLPVAPVEDVPPAEGAPEIPLASAGETAVEPDAKPAIPDTAPPRAPAPSVLPEPVADSAAPARAAPQKAEPAPVAALPEGKALPSDVPVIPASAPATIAPNEPVELTVEAASAKAVPAVLEGETPEATPVRSAPSVLGAPEEAEPAAATPDAQPVPAEASVNPLVEPSGTHAAPAVPSTPAAAETQSDQPATHAPATGEPAAPAAATPPSPAAPTILPGTATIPPPVSAPGRRAALPSGSPADDLDERTPADVRG